MPVPGDPAPRFRLSDLEGRPRSLDEILGAGPALLVFFKVTCPVCQFTLPFIERLYRAAGGSGFQFFAVSQDPEAPTRHFLREFGVTFSVLLDEEAKGYATSNAFGITHVPTAFLVEPDGSISWALNGFSKSELEALGKRLGTAPFRPDEDVPAWKAG